MIYSCRKNISAFLCLLYLALITSNAIPVKIADINVMNVVSIECSGNCDIDGCSLQSRKEHTCCCWKNKLRKEAHENKLCSHDVQLTQFHADKKEPQLIQIEDEYFDLDGNRVETVFKCGFPCSKGELQLTLLNNLSESTPSENYSYKITVTSNDVQYFNSYLSFSSLFTEPPVPPPKIKA